jgi:hypothetical protein
MRGIALKRFITNQMIPATDEEDDQCKDVAAHPIFLIVSRIRPEVECLRPESLGFSPSGQTRWWEKSERMMATMRSDIRRPTMNAATSGMSNIHVVDEELGSTAHCCLWMAAKNAYPPNTRMMSMTGNRIDDRGDKELQPIDEKHSPTVSVRGLASFPLQISIVYPIMSGNMDRGYDQQYPAFPVANDGRRVCIALGSLRAMLPISM